MRAYVKSFEKMLIVANKFESNSVCLARFHG